MLKIVNYPHPALSKKTELVNEFNEDFKKLLENMKFAMKNRSGIGLAANQLAVNKKVFIMQLSDDAPVKVFVNPQIIDVSVETVPFKEGCLSFPGLTVETTRYKSIILQYQDENGNTNNVELDGLASICAQHEMDHLEGITFLDKLSPLKKALLLKKLKK